MVLEKMWRGVLVAPALALGALAAGACGIPHAGPGQIAVVGAETQYADVLSQIGGAFVSVSAIVNNPSADPHNFEASTSVAREIAQARLIVQNGDGYDAFMNQIESATSNPSRRVVTVARLRHQSAAANPHFWYDPTTMPLVARTVTGDLIALAPRHGAYFRAREATFLSHWQRVTRAIAAARRAVGGWRVATTEPVGDDLLAALGLVNLTPWRFQADVMNGVDPSPEDLATQQDLLTHRRVLALVYNSQVASPVTAGLRSLAVAHAVAGVPIAEIMPPRLHVQDWLLGEVTRLESQLRYVLTGEGP